jgi:hypothetical protein
MPFLANDRQCFEHKKDGYLKVCVEEDTTEITFTGDYTDYNTEIVKSMTDSLYEATNR